METRVSTSSEGAIIPALMNSIPHGSARHGRSVEWYRTRCSQITSEAVCRPNQRLATADDMYMGHKRTSTYYESSVYALSTCLRVMWSNVARYFRWTWTPNFRDNKRSSWLLSPSSKCPLLSLWLFLVKLLAWPLPSLPNFF